MNYEEERPWGKFENLLDSNLCKLVFLKKNENKIWV